MLGGLVAPVGLEMPCALRDSGAVLTYASLGPVTLDSSGHITYRIEAPLSAGLGGVKMKILRFDVAAVHDVLGRVTLTHRDIDSTPLSLLELVRNLPPTFKQTTYVDVWLWSEVPPDGSGQLSMSRKTMTLRCDSLTVFPPQSSTYHLQEPVAVLPYDGPDSPVATLERFSPVITHNPG